MPAPILHIALALLVLPLLPDKNPREFIVGAGFPDIRYLGVIERQKSHKTNPSWHSIKRERSSFKAGMEFHALVDIMHDDYMSRHNVYHIMPKECRRNPNFLKFFEDLLVHQTIDKTTWKNVAEYFNVPLKEELALVNNTHAINIWHDSIKRYIATKPTPHSVQQLLDIKLPTWYGICAKIPSKVYAYYIASVLARNIPQLLANNKLRSHIIGFYNQFPRCLESQQEHQAGEHSCQRVAYAY
jgi:hypothetical protein